MTENSKTTAKLAKRGTDGPIAPTTRKKSEAGSLAVPVPEPVTSTILQYALFLAMIASFAWFGYLKSPAMLITAVGGCLGGIALLRFTAIKKFKAPGVQIEMHNLVQARQRTERVTEEALATIEQVRQLGAILSHLSLEMLGRAGLMGEFPWSVKMALRDGLKSQLHALGVPDEEIAAADQTFVDLLRYRHARVVVDAAREECLARHGGKVDAEYMEFQAKTDEGFDFVSRRMPSPEQLRATVAAYSCENVTKAIADYESFNATGKLRAVDMFDSDKKKKG